MTIARRKVNTIVFMYRPRADGMVAGAMLKIQPEAEEKFPGVNTAEFHMLGPGEDPSHWRDLAQKGEAVLIGDRELAPYNIDEHGGQEKTSCAATIAAELIGIRGPGATPRQQMRWHGILIDILRVDTKGISMDGVRADAHGTNIWEAHLAVREPFEQVMGRVVEDIQALLGVKDQLIGTGKALVEPECLKFRGKTLDVSFISNLDPKNPVAEQEANAARMMGADLVVSQLTTGHISVLPGGRNCPKEILMPRIAALWRCLELDMRQQTQPTSLKLLLEPDGEDLNARYVVPGLYFDPRAFWILNGGFSHWASTPRTLLAMEDIQRLVRWACDDQFMRTWAKHFQDAQEIERYL